MENSFLGLEVSLPSRLSSASINLSETAFFCDNRIQTEPGMSPSWVRLLYRGSSGSGLRLRPEWQLPPLGSSNSVLKEGG